MADDLEAFLRQAAQRRAARQKKPAPMRPAAPEPARRQTLQTGRQPPVTPVEVVDAAVVPESPNRLQSHVDTSGFKQRAEHLGAEVGLADENLEARLHAKFDHQLGALDQEKLAPESSGVPTDVGELANEIAKLLADPNSVRTAIVLSEILSPPHHRW